MVFTSGSKGLFTGWAESEMDDFHVDLNRSDWSNSTRNTEEMDSDLFSGI